MEAPWQQPLPLPTKVLNSILSQLPLKVAGRTTVISKAWRDLFHNIPHLVIGGSWGDQAEFDPQRWPSAVKTILRSRGREPISRCKITIDFFVKIDGDLDEILDTLCKKNTIEELIAFFVKIEVLLGRHYYCIPSVVYSCKSLVKLELEGSRLEVPQFFDGFPRLKTLRLTWVIVSSAGLERLVFLCGALEELVLRHCSKMVHVKLRSESLASLEVYTCRMLVISAVEARRLMRVTWICTNFNWNEMKWTNNGEGEEVLATDSPPLALSFAEFGRVRSLHCEFRRKWPGLQLVGQMPAKLSKEGTLIYLEELEMMLDLTNIKLVSVLYCLIRSSLYLRKLVIRGERQTMHRCRFPIYEIFSSHRCKFLLKLELEQLWLAVAENMVHFMRPKSLRLKQVIVTDDELERLVPRLKFLEELVLNHCSKITNVKLRSVTLASLKVYTSRMLVISSSEAHRLGEVTWIFAADPLDSVSEEDDQALVPQPLLRSFMEFADVETLHCEFHRNWQRLKDMEQMPKRLPEENRLILLNKLEMMLDVFDTKLLSVLSCLLRSSPNLKEFTIRAEPYTMHKDRLDFVDLVRSASIISHSLTCLELYHVNKDFYRYLKFAKWVIVKGRKLKEILVHHDPESLSPYQYRRRLSFDRWAAQRLLGRFRRISLVQVLIYTVYT